MWYQVKQELIQSTTKFLTELAHLLPGMVALIVALLISIVLAWMLAIVVRRLLASIHFDERLNSLGVRLSRGMVPDEQPDTFGLANCRLHRHPRRILDRYSGLRCRIYVSASLGMSSTIFQTLSAPC